MKKLLSVLLAALCLLCGLCFVGCQKTGPIPNGKYADTPTSNISYYTEDDSVEFYWEIKGFEAKHYTSNALDYKAKIVEKGGKIYFEGYKWKSPLSSVEMGDEDVYLVEYNKEERSIKWMMVQTEILPNPEYKVPEDFTFSLTWGTFGISSYDSETGLLVKTKDVSQAEKENYQNTYFLTDEEKMRIYDIIYDLGVEKYPNEYNPNYEMGSEPSQTLVLSVQTGDFDKTITAKDIAIGCVGENEKGQKFLDSIDAIVDILTATDEWKALPDYPYLYD